MSSNKNNLTGHDRRRKEQAALQQADLDILLSGTRGRKGNENNNKSEKSKLNKKKTTTKKKTADTIIPPPNINGPTYTTNVNLSSLGPDPSTRNNMSSSSSSSSRIRRNSNPKALVEAKEYEKKAMNAMKTSFLTGKFSPDYLFAGPAFRKAAQFFYMAGNTPENNQNAIKNYVLSGECMEKQLMFDAAAMDLTKAAEIVLEIGEEREKAASYYNQAGDYKLQAGDYGRACDMFLNAMNVLEPINLEAAKEYAFKIEEILIPNIENPIAIREAPTGTDIAQKVFLFYLKNEENEEMIREGLEFGEKVVSLSVAHGMKQNCFKTYLSLTIIQIHLDIILADQSYLKHLQNGDYLQSRECECAEDLIRSVKDQDEEKFEKTRKKIQNLYLDSVVMKYLMSMQFSKVTGMDEFDDDDDDDDDNNNNNSSSSSSSKGGVNDDKLNQTAKEQSNANKSEKVEEVHGIQNLSIDSTDNDDNESNKADKNEDVSDDDDIL